MAEGAWSHLATRKVLQPMIATQYW